MTRWLVLAFITVPLVEIFVIVQVGQVIGGWATVGILLAVSLLGGWLVRREGRRAWMALVESLQAGRAPTQELLDAGIVLVGGTLLLTPGFVTDVLGMAMLLPWSRPVSRRLIQRLVARRLLAGGPPFGSTRPQQPRGGATIPGEVVDDDDETRP